MKLQGRERTRRKPSLSFYKYRFKRTINSRVKKNSQKKRGGY